MKSIDIYFFKQMNPAASEKSCPESLGILEAIPYEILEVIFENLANTKQIYVSSTLRSFNMQVEVLRSSSQVCRTFNILSIISFKKLKYSYDYLPLEAFFFTKPKIRWIPEGIPQLGWCFDIKDWPPNRYKKIGDTRLYDDITDDITKEFEASQKSRLETLEKMKELMKNSPTLHANILEIQHFHINLTHIMHDFRIPTDLEIGAVGQDSIIERIQKFAVEAFASIFGSHS